jgi:hypothetical protein
LLVSRDVFRPHTPVNLRPTLAVRAIFPTAAADAVRTGFGESGGNSRTDFAASFPLSFTAIAPTGNLSLETKFVSLSHRPVLPEGIHLVELNLSGGHCRLQAL